MSGVWGGWMRRLRRGQAGVPAPEADMVQDGVAHMTPSEPDGETHPAGIAGLPEPDEPAWAEDVAPEEDLDDDADGQEVFAFAPVPHAARPSEPAPPAPSLPAPLLLRRGELGACRAAVQAGEDADLLPLVAALTEGEAVLQGLGLGGDTAASAMLAPAGRARRLLVVFGEDDGGFFLMPPPAGQAHVLYLRDDSHCLAMLGVPGLGADYDACLLAILRVARAVAAADVFCVGGGAACYSALRYGLDLGAAGVLAAGILDHVRRGVQAPGLRPGTKAQRLMRQAAQLGAGLGEAYAGAATRPGLVLCRPGQGALTGLAGLPGAVSVEAPQGALGKIWEWAEQSGRLRGMVRDLLACRAVE